MEKCPKCGLPKPTDKEFDNNEARMDFTVDIPTGVWSWECFNCNHEWKEKDGKVID